MTFVIDMLLSPSLMLKALIQSYSSNKVTKSTRGIFCFQEIGRVLCEEQLGPCFIPYEMCGEAVCHKRLNIAK